MANYYQVSPEEIRTSLSQQEGGEANIANSLRTRKAVEALVANAKIADGEWIDETNAPVAVEAEKDAEAEEKPKKKTAKAEKKPKAEKAEKEEPKKETKKKAAKKD